MKKNIALLLTVTAACLAAFTARADTTNIQVVPFHVQSVSGPGCPGTYTGYAYMTNSGGIMWLKPAINSTGATFTDLSGNTSATCVHLQLPVTAWCDTNSVTFPVVSSGSYEMYIYVQNAGLTNGQPMKLQVVWH
jgi:hypothetical protein